MKSLVSGSVTPSFIALQQDRNGLFSRICSVVEATARAAIFARQCEQHFNLYGQVSPQAMAKIAERTKLAGTL